MISRPGPLGPMKQSVCFGNRNIIYRCVSHGHVAFSVKFPVFVAVGAKPLAIFVVVFIAKAHGDAIVAMRPDLLDQSIPVFHRPLPDQETAHLIPAVQEFRPVAPFCIVSIGQHHLFGIARVPCVLCHANFFDRIFVRKGWHWHPGHREVTRSCSQGTCPTSRP